MNVETIVTAALCGSYMLGVITGLFMARGAVEILAPPATMPPRPPDGELAPVVALYPHSPAVDEHELYDGRPFDWAAEGCA